MLFSKKKTEILKRYIKNSKKRGKIRLKRVQQRRKVLDVRSILKNRNN